VRDAVVGNVRYCCERCRRGECEMPLGNVVWTGRKGCRLGGARSKRSGWTINGAVSS